MYNLCTNGTTFLNWNTSKKIREKDKEMGKPNGEKEDRNLFGNLG